MSRLREIARALLLASLVGCAGFQRGCASGCAQSLGADWIAVQYRADGSPINCWRLTSVSIANEQGSDGIYWREPSGHLVHISGWYNRVQVDGGRWDEAARSLGVDLGRCTDGKYAAPGATP